MYFIINILIQYFCIRCIYVTNPEIAAGRALLLQANALLPLLKMATSHPLLQLRALGALEMCSADSECVEALTAGA